MKGNRSPYGLRGVICERFGWTYDYLLNGLPWFDINLMMVDAPFYVYHDDSKVDITKISKPKEAAQKLDDYFKSFNF